MLTVEQSKENYSHAGSGGGISAVWRPWSLPAPLYRS